MESTYFKLEEEQRIRGRHWKGLRTKTERFKKLLLKVEKELKLEEKTFKSLSDQCRETKCNVDRLKQMTTKSEIKLAHLLQEKEVLIYQALQARKRRQKLEDMYLK